MQNEVFISDQSKCSDFLLSSQSVPIPSKPSKNIVLINLPFFFPIPKEPVNQLFLRWFEQWANAARCHGAVIWYGHLRQEQLFWMLSIPHPLQLQLGTQKGFLSLVLWWLLAPCYCQCLSHTFFKAPWDWSQLVPFCLLPVLNIPVPVSFLQGRTVGAQNFNYCARDDVTIDPMENNTVLSYHYRAF